MSIRVKIGLFRARRIRSAYRNSGPSLRSADGTENSPDQAIQHEGNLVALPPEMDGSKVQSLATERGSSWPTTNPTIQRLIDIKPGATGAVYSLLCQPRRRGIRIARRSMNHHHRKVLQALFDHPISANIAFKDVERLLEDLGATLDARSGDRMAVTLKGHTAVFHKAHHSVPKDEIVNIRHFLNKCGVDPVNYPV